MWCFPKINFQMGRRLFLIAGILAQGWAAAAQLAVQGTPPPALAAGAAAVIRDDELTITVKGPADAIVSRHKVVTVLNPNGRDQGALEVDYEKARPVTDISGAMYDASGQLMRRFRKSDFEDVSASQDFSLFEDDRMKRIEPGASRYPYTVVYDYEQHYKFTLFLPGWFPVEAPGVAVEQSGFSVTVPEDIPLRYYTNQAGAPVVDSARKSRTYRWRIRDLAAFPDEPLMPPIFASKVPLVLVSPERFSYYGMKGSFSDWKGLGSWISAHLLKDRDRLSDATVSRVREMVAGAASPQEAAARIYAYVQHNTHYISIQVGKGGLVPMNASDVDRVGYGDCKALVNYTMALLKAAGIPAYYTLVYGGTDRLGMLPDFASAGQGNHVILCVPFGRDTTWLECTDKHIPFGFLGSFTDDRNVVVCTPEGGILTHTPAYADTLNRLGREARFTLDSAGDLRGRMRTVFSGLSYEKRAEMEPLSAKERVRQVRSSYGYLQMDVDTLRLDYRRTALPAAREDLCFTSSLYAAPDAAGMTVPLNPVDRFGDVPSPSRRRVNDVLVMRGYETADTLDFTLPAGAKVSLMPAPVRLDTRFGRYETRIITGGDHLRYIRSFRLKSGDYPASSYQDLVQFLGKVSASDRDNFHVTL